MFTVLSLSLFSIIKKSLKRQIVPYNYFIGILCDAKLKCKESLCQCTHLPKTASDAVKILFKIDHVPYPSFLQHTKHIHMYIHTTIRNKGI